MTRTAACILSDVSDAFSVSIDRLQAPSKGWRDIEAAMARQAAYALLRSERKLSLTQIGRQLGNRHHSTVLTGIAKAQERMASDADFAARYRKAAT